MLATNTIHPATTPELLGCQVPPFCLRLHGGPLDGQEIRLASAKVSIGGAPGCTLRLRSPGSLPLYLWVLRGPEGCVVRRFAPHVLLNGGAFDEASLYDGDRLRIGGIELEVVSGAMSTLVELEETEGAFAGSEAAEDAIFRADACDREQADEAVLADPWMRPYKRAFASRANQTSQQRRALRQHLARRTRKLLETLRLQDRELEGLKSALQQKSADAVRLTSAQQAEADYERIQLEEEARELAELVQQMTCELREASVQRTRTSTQLEQQNALRTQMEQREAELQQARNEADEVRRSTAAQIEQLKHAFELVCRERDELAQRQQREVEQGGTHQATIESLQAELREMSARRGALQARLEVVTQQLTTAEQLRSAEQPQLEQQLKSLNVELERRDRELAEARSAGSMQSQQLLATLDQLRQELAELQNVRQRDRQQASTEAQRLSEDLAGLKAQLSQRETELRTARTSGESGVAALQAELERAQADAAHVRQQLTRERSDAAASRAQLEAELKSTAQQLDRRTADWQSSQQTASAEATQFSKTIEQLRGELQSERLLREQDAEARQAERRQSETELASVHQNAQEQANQIEALQRKLSSEVNRLTLQLDQAQREVADVVSIHETELARWNDKIDALQQTVGELTTARTAAERQLDESARNLDLAQRELSDLEAHYAAKEAAWSQERDELLHNVDSLASANREQYDQLASNQQGVASDQQQLHSELISAAEQLRALGEQNHELREQLAELQLTLDQAQANLAALEGSSVVAGERMAESAAVACQDERVLADREELLIAQRQFEAEKEQWKQQHEAWEAGLQQREEELAAQIAELERQVGEWHSRQSQEQQLQQHPLHEAMSELPPATAPNAIYGSYTPPHNELPADVTMPLPVDRGVREIDAHESFEVAIATEAPRDSDSVDAVLGRLMQAGLWHADAAEEPVGRDRTMGLDQLGDASRLNQLSPTPDFDPPMTGELPEHTDAGEGEDDSFGRTMDIGSLMGNRGEMPRSWRAELLGDEQPSDEQPTAEAGNDPLAALRALRAEVAEERLDGASDQPESEIAAEIEAKLPEQAVGHGSWRAQLLGGDAESDPATPASGLLSSAELMNEVEDAAEQVPPTFTPVAPPPAEPTGHAGEDEDSIEAYMSKLLKRVRGDAHDSGWSAPAATAPVVAPKPAKPVAAVSQQPATPVEPSEFVPQRQAPEASVSLAAMREIANAASRVAIDTHTKRRHTERFAQRLIKAGVALFTTVGFTVWGLYSGYWGPWCGVAVGMLLMAYWSAQSLWHIARALRLKPVHATAGDPEETAEFVQPSEPATEAAQE